MQDSFQDPHELDPEATRARGAAGPGPSFDAVPPPPIMADGTVVPPPLPGASPVEPAPPPPPPVRDRILLLGRRKAGKSVFLARLYERLWHSKGDIHMAAVDGQTHVSLLTQIDEMNKRRWPAATEMVSQFTIDVTYRGERFTMVAPDYPGEVFRRAFMSGADEPAVRELLSNIDRAAAVIVLVDPHVALEGDILTHSEQDFGLVAAIKRIRDSHGADFVPVAITLTKCDRYREEIEEAGGPGKYIRKHYANLCRVVFHKGRQGTVFACSAVGIKRDGLGKEIPDLAKPPRGLIEPLEYCLEALQRNRALVEEQRSRELLAAEARAVAQRVEEEERRATRMSNAFLFGSLALAGLVIAVLVYVMVVRQ